MMDEAGKEGEGGGLKREMTGKIQKLDVLTPAVIDTDILCRKVYLYPLISHRSEFGSTAPY